MRNWGFERIAGIREGFCLGEPKKNAQNFLASLPLFESQGVSVVVTPELAMTGYTCEDLFHVESLHEDVESAISLLLQESKKFSVTLVVGTPLRLSDGRLLNVAMVIDSGKIVGVVPKIFLPNMGEFYERRWFTTGRFVREKVDHPKWGSFWVSPYQVFQKGSFRFGIEICQDLWSPAQPSEQLALQGAQVILNLSASNELVSKRERRKVLAAVQSDRLLCGYFYLSSGDAESTKDTVFSGHAFAYELSEKIAEVVPFQVQTEPFIVDFDLEHIRNRRMREVCFMESLDHERNKKTDVSFQVQSCESTPKEIPQLKRKIPHDPFLSEIQDPEEVLEIQAQGLWARAKKSKVKSLIIGVSGGLDSTHALWVSLVAKRLSGNQLKVIGVSMPGPGTSEKTKNLAKSLIEAQDCDLQLEIPIHAAVELHLQDLAALPAGVVFENAQARERTQVLFDLANQHEGMVVGTGDLSELALGWCTFNADHMAHYAVNAGIPKTVVRMMVEYQKEMCHNRRLRPILEKILALPISPELLPPSEDGEISQHTEEVLGPFELHDFFLYHLLSFGSSPEKILFLAKYAFQDFPKWLTYLEKSHGLFFQRFYSQAFKRSTLPPGPKVHGVSLSPRSDFRLPDELHYQKR